MSHAKNILLPLLIMCVGCATSNFSKITYKNSPKGIPTSQTAIIYFMRQNVKPTMMNPKILVNNVKVGKLPNNSFFWVEAPPGEKFIDTKWSWDAGANDDTIRLNVEANKKYYLILKPLGEKILPWYYARFYNKFFVVEDEDIAVHNLEEMQYFVNK